MDDMHGGHLCQQPDLFKNVCKWNMKGCQCEVKSNVFPCSSFCFHVLFGIHPCFP